MINIWGYTMNKSFIFLLFISFTSQIYSLSIFGPDGYKEIIIKYNEAIKKASEAIGTNNKVAKESLNNALNYINILKKNANDLENNIPLKVYIENQELSGMKDIASVRGQKLIKDYVPWLNKLEMQIRAKIEQASKASVNITFLQGTKKEIEAYEAYKKHIEKINSEKEKLEEPIQLHLPPDLAHVTSSFLKLKLLSFAQWKSLREELIKAIKSGDVKTVKELLEKGLDPNDKEGNGQTLLSIASYGQHGNEEINKEIVEELLSFGADPNIPNIAYYYDTPLMAASMRGYPKIVELLLKNGARVNEKNETTNKLTALELALREQKKQFRPEYQERYKNVIEFLRNKGATE